MKTVKTGSIGGFSSRPFGLRFPLEAPVGANGEKQDGGGGAGGSGGGAPAVHTDPEALYKRFESMLDTKLESYGKALDEKFALHKRAVDAIRDGAAAVQTHDGKVLIAPNEKRGLQAAAFVRAVAASKFFGVSVMDVAKRWKDDALVGNLEAAQKTMQAQNAESAGLLVPDTVMAEVTDLLRAAVVVEASGAVTVPMPNGSLSMNFQRTSATGRYDGEIAPIQTSQPTFGRMKMAAKKLGALVPVSNDLIRFAGPQVNPIVRDDLVSSLSIRKDLALIRDDGSQSTPKGLRWLAPLANVAARSLDAGIVTLDTVTDDLVGRINVLESANVKMLRPGWLLHPRTKNFLSKLRDGNGNRVYRDEMRGGTLEGYPFRVTTNIPVTLGAGGDETEIYFVDFASIMVGEAYDLELSVSDVASYDDGTQKNGFQTDETLVRALMAHDINARYRGAEISILTTVDWY